jgi:hypothetical protein
VHERDECIAEGISCAAYTRVHFPFGG